MFIDADASKSPRRRRISGVYPIEAQRKRRRREAAARSSLPPPEATEEATTTDARARRRRSDAQHLAAALRQLGRGATVLQLAEDALCGLQSRLEALRGLARPALRADLSAAQRIAHGVRFSRLASEAVDLVEGAVFEDKSLFGPSQPGFVLTLGRVELPLELVDLSLVPRGLPALSLSSPIGAEAAAAVCVTSTRRVDEGLLAVARLRHDVVRIVDGYRHAQRALRNTSTIPPAGAESWPPPLKRSQGAGDEAATEAERAVRCQSSSDPDDVLHRIR